MAEAKYSEWFRGWVGCFNGKLLRAKNRAVKVFRGPNGEQEALKAAQAKESRWSRYVHTGK